MLLDDQDCQLLLVDYQTRLMQVMADGALVTAQALRLARIAALLRVPVLATEQNPERLGPTEPALREAVLGECRGQVFAKMSFSAATEAVLAALRPPARAPAAAGNARSLPRHLQKAQAAERVERGSIVLAGCETHVCLLQTALELLEQDFEVWVVTDACSSRSERNRDAAFDRLAANGAELVTTEMVAFEWMRSAAHPQFKAIQALIK